MKLGTGLRLSLLWPWILTVVSIAGVVLLLTEDRGGVLVPVLLTLAAAGGAFLSLRVFILLKRIRNFLDHLLRNDYETGMKTRGLISDEIQSIYQRANKAASQLGEYERLCSDRIRLQKAQLDILMRTSPNAFMIGDMKAMSFRINPAMKRLFGIEQDSFSFESIQKQDGNERFFRKFLVATLRSGFPHEGTAVLQLPLRESRREITFRIVPIKDSTEKTAFALVFIEPVDDDAGENPQA